MMHVDFDKYPCHPIEYKSQGPHYNHSYISGVEKAWGLWIGGGGPHVTYQFFKNPYIGNAKKKGLSLVNNDKYPCRMSL